MSGEERDEADVLTDPCSWCGVMIATRWVKNGGGMIPTPGVELVCDSVFHDACWNAMIEEYPPDAP